MTVRVAIFISGGGSNMEKLIDSMEGDHPARPCLVLSNVEGAGGIDKARARSVPTVVVPHRHFPDDRPGFEQALQEAMAPYRPDLICLAGFMRKLTAEFVNRWAGAMLNIHPSLLPMYRGLDTHARVLEAGDRQHGCTVHEVTPALDDGPILGQARLDVRDGDTPETLARRVLLLEHRLYPAVLRRFAAGDRTPVRFSADNA